MTDDPPKSPPPTPQEIQGHYDEEITSHSYKELETLALWAKHKGPIFYLIGGWAAWRYHRGLGSRDIDVIFPDTQILDSFLQQHYKANGFENHGGLLSKRYRKRVDLEDRTFLIQIDAAGLDHGPPFKEDPNRTIPYTELEEHSVEWTLGTGTTRIPTPELLILQKTKAWRDRRWDLEHEATNPVDIQYLRGKIWKDAYDIRSLEPIVEDWATVWEIAQTHECTDLIQDAFATLEIDTDLPAPES